MTAGVAVPGLAADEAVSVPASVRRGSRGSLLAGAVLAAAVVALFLAPYATARGTQVQLVVLFGYVLLATMWNLLAGYGGMVSIGQQAFIGVGAYGLVYLCDNVGIHPFVGVPLAAAVAGAVAWASSFLVFRLAGGYFAIGTWVLAEVFRLLVTQVDAVGAGSGTSLRAWSGYGPAYRVAYVYWTALTCTIVAVLAVYLIMRSRLGLGLTAIRDDPTAAGSLGVRVTRSRRLVWVVAGAGSGLLGAVIASNTLRVQPESVFSVNYTAFAIFMVVIGGIGTIEGPILGAVLFYALQDLFADAGTWYLVVLGVLAVLFTLYVPGGLWGWTRGRIELFPVRYRLSTPGLQARRPR